MLDDEESQRRLKEAARQMAEIEANFERGMVTLVPVLAKFGRDFAAAHKRACIEIDDAYRAARERKRGG